MEDFPGFPGTAFKIIQGVLKFPERGVTSFLGTAGVTQESRASVDKIGKFAKLSVIVLVCVYVRA